MAKTVYKVPFGEGYRILQHGNLSERAALASRYPLIATASPEEILTAINRITLRQVESDLREFVSEGNRIGSKRVPSLSEFATVVEDSQTEEDIDPEAKSETLSAADAISATSEDVEEPEEPAEVLLKCDEAGCEATFTSERGRKIHMTRVHGTTAVSISDVLEEREQQVAQTSGPVDEEPDFETKEELDIFLNAEHDVDDDGRPSLVLDPVVEEEDDDDDIFGIINID